MTVRSATNPRALVIEAERRFRDSDLVFGHGTDNPRDEAVLLVFSALGIPFDAPDRVIERPLAPASAAEVRALIDLRIATRRPSAYLTNRMWFAGLEFWIDDRVLVPRSPLAELIVAEFRPWIDPARIERVLEIGTGSGCIAIAIAQRFPRTRVDAVDLSSAALDVARRNSRHYGLEQRVRLIEADVYPDAATKYQLIISNPPYVPRLECDALPAEYHHEPRVALEAGRDGLDVIDRIIAGAGARLTRDGVLVMDVGLTADAMTAAYPDIPFVWVELEHGGEGVCVVEAGALQGGAANQRFHCLLP